MAEGLEGVVIEPNFVGLKHYKDSFSDMRLWKALWNTTFFTVVSVAIELVLGLGIALLINKAVFWPRACAGDDFDSVGDSYRRIRAYVESFYTMDKTALSPNISKRSALSTGWGIC